THSVHSGLSRRRCGAGGACAGGAGGGALRGGRGPRGTNPCLSVVEAAVPRWRLRPGRRMPPWRATARGAAAAWREGTGRHGSRPAAAVPDAAAGAPLPLGQAPPRSRSPTDAMAAPSSAAGVAAVVGVLVLLVAGVSGARLPARGAAILGAALPRGGASGGPSRRSGAFPASYAPASPRPTPSTCNLAQHAECVKVEYDPRLIEYRQLLYVFWASHDPREVFGQGSDVGNQYRSVIVGGLQTLAASV
ncbi:unnamed protein product, partial [Urochloa humidicola]